jgi:hypothetical protein
VVVINPEKEEEGGDNEIEQLSRRSFLPQLSTRIEQRERKGKATHDGNERRGNEKNNG